MKRATDFEKFQRYFKEYQRLFGLMDYKIYFKHESLDGCFADITVEQADMVGTVRFNSTPDKQYLNVRGSAKHEAIHLLLWRLEDRASSRYIQAKELYETVEGLVRKLEALIDK